MSTIRLLKARLDELLVAQPLLVQEAAQLVLSIPRIIDSQVYGLALREPHAFIAFLQSQLRLAGSDLPPGTTPSSELIAQVNELRTFIYVHLRRVGLHLDAAYDLITQFPEGFALPGESHNLGFSEAFLAVADAIVPGHNFPNDSDGLIHFARAFLSTTCRAYPILGPILRTDRECGIEISWFIICLYTGSAHISNCNPAMLSAGDTGAGYASVAHILAYLLVGGSFEDIGDVARQFRRAPATAFTESRPLPEGLQVLSLDLWQQLTFSEQEIAILLGRQSRETHDTLWYDICRYQKAFFAYCRQIVAGNFDASAFQTPDTNRLTNALMQFMLNNHSLQMAIEGVRFLYNPPNSAHGMQPAEVQEWNARLFAQWKTQTGYDDHHDIDIRTDRTLSAELLHMALVNGSIDVQLLSSEQQLTHDSALDAPFPGFEASETSGITAEAEGDFSVLCLFCTSRLSDSEQSGGELAYKLSCCGGRAGAVCLRAYKRSSSHCPFCSQVM